MQNRQRIGSHAKLRGALVIGEGEDRTSGRRSSYPPAPGNERATMKPPVRTALFALLVAAAFRGNHHQLGIVFAGCCAPFDGLNIRVRFS